MKPKRLISLLVAVCMMITMLPLSAVTAFAADTATGGTASYKGYKYGYKVNADGNATITKFLGPDASANPVDSASTVSYDIEIPEKLGIYTVTGLGENSFAVDSYDGYKGNPLCSNIHSVTIPQNVKSVGYRAFHNCDGLESLTFHGESIGNFAFDGCTSLKTLSLGENIQTIGGWAFQRCSSLKNVTIPESVTVIQDHAFSDCESLSSVLFAGDEEATDNALQIGSYAFFCCEQLMDVTLPKRVTQIGDFAFGVTEQQKVNSDGSTSDETENIAVSGFLLTGYEGAAAKYISSSRSNGIRINFKSLQIPWVKIVSISLGCTAGLVLIFLLVRMIKKKRLSAADKEALEAAEQERKIPLSQREPDPEPEEPEEPDYVSILEDMSHSQMTHQFGHGTLPQESETDSNAESSETTSKSTK